MKFTVEKWTRDDGATCFTVKPIRRGSRKDTPMEARGKSTKPTEYTLVKRGRSFSQTTSGYRALTRDYPLSWREATGACLAILRDEGRVERETILAETPVVTEAESVAGVVAIKVDGKSFLVIKSDRGKHGVRFMVLVESEKVEGASRGTAFVFHRGKLKLNGAIELFSRKYNSIYHALVKWMIEVDNAKHQ